jgi:hypothetical protein
MRESRTFAERTRMSEIDRTVKKYFLVYEGSNTEQIYFNAVNGARTTIGISPIIELIPIVRSYSEEGWSNPKKILDRIIKDIDESKTGLISYETMLNRIMDYFNEEKVFSTEKANTTVWDLMKYICEEKICKSMNEVVDDVETECTNILLQLKEELKTENIILDISEVIEKGGITYAEDFDKICLIVDRDRESFISTPQNNQYLYVLNKCIEKKFGFYVTNPCFEFWLLLHFDEVFALDRNKLLLNPKVTAKRRYAEDELRRVFPKYKKACYNAGILVNSVDRAIENEKKFCEDIMELEKCLGSNLGKLIDEMRK